jgi:hypothetical protein
MVRMAERGATELWGLAVQEMVLLVVETVSQVGAPVTVQVVKSAGVGVTVMEPDARQAAGAVAEVGLRATVQVAPDWVRVKVLSPMVRMAERGATRFWGAVQLMVLFVVETVSQAGAPVTVQVVKSVGVGVTVMEPDAPAAGAVAAVGLRVTGQVGAGLGEGEGFVADGEGGGAGGDGVVGGGRFR